jgi:hypothetical protein
LDGQHDSNLKVFVVWEPVLPTDFFAPSTRTLGRLADRRASQYWDKGHLISHLLGEHDEASAIWDYVAVYERGKLWDQAPPAPEYSHVPVVEGIDETTENVRRLLTR